MAPNPTSTHVAISISKRGQLTIWRRLSEPDPVLSFIDDQTDGIFKLLPLFQRAMRNRQLSGERYDGNWHNIGNVEQLKALDVELKERGENGCYSA